MNVLDIFNNNQIKKLTDNKVIPSFRAGDTLSMKIDVSDGLIKRYQVFEGICIAKKNAGLHSNFSVRKLCTGNIWVLRKFFIYSTNIVDIKVIKKGKVRKSKIYYMLNRYGKSARISARIEKTRS
ncbi:MAG: 50S ribosomal protein L19 [Anaplasmataceae bacterium]|nr:50S ribosomal protein L19 [Anaplasmataceae bacterium]